MFCDQCGAHLQAGQGSCVRCGKAVTAPLEYGRHRVREHVKLVAILWMAYSALHVVGGVLILAFAKFVVVRLAEIPNGPPPEILIWLRPLIGVVGWLVLAKAAMGIVTGWGLLQREEWARVVALVFGFLALLSVPIGTALGIYTLWVLLPSQSEEEYRTLARAA
jgi:predicted nucleic acid-binding Zn ribbon protein